MDALFRRQSGFLYYATLEKLGIRRLTLHKARHTFFTMFDAMRDDKLAMALIGGHTDPNFTERQYVHPDIDRLRRAIEQIGIFSVANKWFRASQDKEKTT